MKSSKIFWQEMLGREPEIFCMKSMCSATELLSLWWWWWFLLFLPLNPTKLCMSPSVDLLKLLCHQNLLLLGSVTGLTPPPSVQGAGFLISRVFHPSRGGKQLLPAAFCVSKYMVSGMREVEEEAVCHMAHGSGVQRCNKANMPLG